MDIVLGVSMTPTTVRMVLVEGEKADGSIVDHDVFNITTTTADDGSATSSSAAEQVVEAVLGTKESAAEGGHHLKSIGVTWSDHAEASTLRDALAARGVDDVMLVSDGHAAGALAQAVGRAVGYATTALLFIDRDSAALSVVQTDDGSVVKVLSRSLHSDDAMGVLTEMAAAVAEQDTAPQGLFVVGSGVDVSSVKAHLENLVSIPVSAPEEPEIALARGAALASANAPTLEATTVGLAYSQDPDGSTAGNAYVGLAAAETQLASVGAVGLDAAQTDMEPIAPEEGRKPFMLVGSALTSIFVVGVVALVISLAVSIRPTVDQRPAPGEAAIAPSSIAPAPPPAQEALQPVAPAPPPETIKPPIPVAVQETPAPQEAPAPRKVFVQQQAPVHQAAPAPEAPPPAPAPEAPPPAPVPDAPPPAPAPVAPAPFLAPPAYNPYLPSQGYYPQPRQYSPWQSPPSEEGPGGYPGYGGYPGSGGYPGGGYPGSGGYRGGGGGCFLIFCRR